MQAKMTANNNPTPEQYHYYPVKNAKADLFHEIQYLARQSDCKTLRQVALQPVRQRGAGVTIDGRFYPQQVVTQFYPERREKIVSDIRHRLQNGGIFQLTTEEWEHLEDLTATYQAIDGERLKVQQWRRVKEVLNRHRSFYNLVPMKIRV